MNPSASWSLLQQMQSATLSPECQHQTVLLPESFWGDSPSALASLPKSSASLSRLIFSFGYSIWTLIISLLKTANFVNLVLRPNCKVEFK
jgi:hypothetical protein